MPTPASRGSPPILDHLAQRRSTFGHPLDHPLHESSVQAARHQWTGTEISRDDSAPISPAITPTTAPSPTVIGAAWCCCSRYAATTPPPMTHMQQQQLPALMIGSAESTPMTDPPRQGRLERAAWARV